jgi:hypothetical protein
MLTPGESRRLHLITMDVGHVGAGHADVNITLSLFGVGHGHIDQTSARPFAMAQKTPKRIFHGAVLFIARSG